MLEFSRVWAYCKENVRKSMYTQQTLDYLILKYTPDVGRVFGGHLGCSNIKNNCAGPVQDRLARPVQQILHHDLAPFFFENPAHVTALCGH